MEEIERTVKDLHSVKSSGPDHMPASLERNILKDTSVSIKTEAQSCKGAGDQFSLEN